MNLSPLDITKPSLAHARFSRLVNSVKPLTQEDRAWLAGRIPQSSSHELLRMVHAHREFGEVPVFIDALVAALAPTLGVFEAYLRGPELRQVLSPAKFAEVRSRLCELTSLNVFTALGPQPVPEHGSSSAPAAPKKHDDNGPSCDLSIAAARAATTIEVLLARAPCLSHHPRHGAEFLEIVREHVERSAEPEPELLGLLGQLLDDVGWKKKGPELVSRFLRARLSGAIMVLVWGYPLYREWSWGRSDATLKAIHVAVAEGLLSFAEHARTAGDEQAVARALTAIAHLELPRRFTRDLHGFAKRDGLSPALRELALDVDRAVKDRSGLDALNEALREAIFASHAPDAHIDEPTTA